MKGNHRSGPRVLAVAAVCALACLWGSGTALAQPQPQPLSAAAQPDVAQTYGEARASIAPAAVDSYVQENDVSQATALDRLATQNMVLNPQERFARDVGAERLSNIWFDNETGEWVIPVTDRDAIPAASAVVAELGLEGRARVVVAPLSAEEMSATMHRLGSRFTERDVRVHFGIGLGKLRVRLSDALTEETVREIRAAVAATGASAAFETRPDHEFDPKPTAACSFPTCDFAVAGVRIDSARGGCSLGFLVGQGGQPFYLTAGHCGSTGYPGYDGVGTWWNSCRPTIGGCPVIGQATSSFWNEQGDAQIVRVDGGWASPWQLTSGWINWWNTGVTTPTSWDTTNTPSGVTLCANGATTGSSCGNVTLQYATVYTAGDNRIAFYVYDMLETDHSMCVQQGDSGGPLTRANVAWASGLITNGNLRGVCGVYRTNGMPIQRAMNIFGLVLYG